MLRLSGGGNRRLLLSLDGDESALDVQFLRRSTNHTFQAQLRSANLQHESLGVESRHLVRERVHDGLLGNGQRQRRATGDQISSFLHVLVVQDGRQVDDGEGRFFRHRYRSGE